MALEPGHLLQGLAPLELMKYTPERAAKRAGRDRVLLPSFVQGKERLVLEREHDKARHERIHQRDFGVLGTMVDDCGLKARGHWERPKFWKGGGGNC